MLLVDDRIGSKDLLLPLQRYGVSCDLQRLEFADFAFIGRGIDDADVFVGIELKETRDLISSLRSARFAGHQLPGLQATYDRAWLLTEGIWRAGDGGVLETYAGAWRRVSIGKHPIMACDLESWLLTQIIRGGLSYWHASTRHDTVRFLATLYHWWTDKSTDEHRSHQQIYLAPPDRVSLIEPSPIVKMISCLPHVGWEKAHAIHDACRGSMQTLCDMTEQELLLVDGIGSKIARQIVTMLRGYENSNKQKSR